MEKHESIRKIHRAIKHPHHTYKNILPCTCCVTAASSRKFAYARCVSSCARYFTKKTHSLQTHRLWWSRSNSIYNMDSFHHLLVVSSHHYNTWCRKHKTTCMSSNRFNISSRIVVKSNANFSFAIRSSSFYFIYFSRMYDVKDFWHLMFLWSQIKSKQQLKRMIK